MLFERRTTVCPCVSSDTWDDAGNSQDFPAHFALCEPRLEFPFVEGMAVMPGFAPHCPKCNSEDVEQIGSEDHYSKGSDGSKLLSATVFAYRCPCGLAFNFEIPHRQPNVSRLTGLREAPLKRAGFQLGGESG